MTWSPDQLAEMVELALVPQHHLRLEMVAGVDALVKAWCGAWVDKERTYYFGFPSTVVEAERCKGCLWEKSRF